MNKHQTSLALLIMFLMPSWSSAQQQCPNNDRLGDLNGDGFVNAIDIGIFRNAVFSGGETPVLSPPPQPISPMGITVGQTPWLTWTHVSQTAVPNDYTVSIQCPPEFPTVGYSQQANNGTCAGEGDAAQCTWFAGGTLLPPGQCRWRVAVSGQECVSPEWSDWAVFTVE